MKRYLVRQAGTVLASLLVLVIATFAIVQLIPGDPARAVAGVDASQEQVEQVRENLGMNKPLFVQFMTYLHGLITGNLGRSFRTNEAVTDIIATRLPYTAGRRAAGDYSYFYRCHIVRGNSRHRNVRE
jgi:peptide/nickel transport system permease protein